MATTVQFNYWAVMLPLASPNVRTVMLISPRVIVQYTDTAQEYLPSAFEQIIRSWNCDIAQLQQEAQCQSRVR